LRNGKLGGAGGVARAVLGELGGARHSGRERLERGPPWPRAPPHRLPYPTTAGSLSNISTLELLSSRSCRMDTHYFPTLVGPFAPTPRVRLAAALLLRYSAYPPRYIIYPFPRLHLYVRRT
jgi:hypothetical protein